MNGLPEDIDLSPIKGRQITQICFGAWHVSFVFDNPIHIVVESRIVLRNPRGEVTHIDDFRQGAAKLCTLIGLNIVDAARTPAGGMTLRVFSGAELEIEAEQGPYESFQVKLDDRTIVA